MVENAGLKMYFLFPITELLWDRTFLYNFFRIVIISLFNRWNLPSIREILPFGNTLIEISWSIEIGIYDTTCKVQSSIYDAFTFINERFTVLLIPIRPKYCTLFYANPIFQLYFIWMFRIKVLSRKLWISIYLHFYFFSNINFHSIFFYICRNIRAA